MIAEHPNGLRLYVGPDGQPYFHRPGMLGWTPLGSRSRLVGLGFNFFKDVCCDKSSIGGKVGSVVTAPARAVGSAVNSALGGTFIGSAVRAAGRAVQTGLDAVSKAAKGLSEDIHKLPIIGSTLGTLFDVVADPVTLPLAISDDIAHGDSPWKVATDAFQHELANAKEAAPYVAAVVSFVPGIGPVAAACIAGGVAIAEGKPLDEILVAAGTAAIPGGAVIEAGYEAARTVITHRGALALDTLANAAITGIASAGGVTIPPDAVSAIHAATKFTSDVIAGKNVKEAGIDSIVAGIPAGDPDLAALKKVVAASVSITKTSVAGTNVGNALFGYALAKCPAQHREDIRKSLSVALAMGHGASLQAVKQSKVPDLLTKLEAVGAADTTAVVAAARAALAGKGVRGFNVGHGLMQFRGDEFQTRNLRAELGNAADQKGFDVALALRIGNVASTLPAGVSSPAVAAGMLIATGAQTASSAQKAAIHGTVAGDPAVAAGVNIVHTTITPLEWWSLGALAAGTALLIAGVAVRG